MIWLNADRLARVQRSRDLNTLEWVRLAQLCENYLSLPLPYGGHEQNFALAGLISGDQRFKAKAIQLAMDRCALGYKALDGWGYGHWGACRVVIPSLCCVFDWLYQDMTAVQRTTLATWIRNFGNLCWTETQPPDKLSTWARLPIRPGDNFAGGYLLGSWSAGLALTAHTGLVADGQKLLDLSRRKWSEEFVPHRARYEPEGFPKEGSGYGVQRLMNELLAMDAEFSMTGAQVWPDAARLINQYLLHMTTPDLTRILLMGDNARIVAGKGVTLLPLDDYVKALAWIAQNHVPVTGSPTSFAWWLSNINPMPPGGWQPPSLTDGYEQTYPAHLQLPAGVREHPGYLPDPPTAFGAQMPEAGPSPFHWLAWMPLLFARPELRETGAGLRVPMISPGNGFVVGCQVGAGTLPDKPDSNATMLHFQAGQHLEAHEDKAPGSLLIYKAAELLIGSARHWGYQTGLGRDTIYHSTLHLSPHHVSEPAWKADVPEPLKRAHESIKLTRGEEKDGVLYLEADLAGAYAFVGPWHADPEQWVRSPLKRWIRRVLWHRAKDLFVVIDEVEKEPWAAPPVIAWQVREAPTAFSDGWRSDVNGYQTQGYALTPGDVTTATQVGNSWRVEVKLSGIAPSVTALRVTRSGEAFLPAVLYNQNGRLGATFGAGANAVTLAVQMGDASPPPPPQRRVYHLNSGPGLPVETFTDATAFSARVVAAVEATGEIPYTVFSHLETA